jgi:hypothetical protein
MKAIFQKFLQKLGWSVLLILVLTSCTLPQIKAEDRLFLNLSLEFVGVYQLPKLDFEGTKVGGLSGLTYDRQRNCFYAISDDRSAFAPAHFYRLALDLTPANSEETNRATAATSTSAPVGFTPKVTIEQVIFLKAADGKPYARGSIDPEGIALSPRQSVFISSEGDASQGIAPFIDEFDLSSGNWRSRLPILSRYLPRRENEQISGVQNNRGFESLTLNAGSYGGKQLEPFRLFSATESALQQDLPPESNAALSSPEPTYLRFLHYLIGQDQPLLLAEHFYPLDPPPEGSKSLGLTELLVLDQGGHFLSLERAFGATGFSGKIFQLALGAATDVSSIAGIAGNAAGLTPIYKRPLLDLNQLGIPLDNFEGMVLGPRLPDGSQSLLLVSDDNFNPLQTTEFLLLRLRQG